LIDVLAFALVEVKRAGWGFLSLAIGGLTKPQAFVFGPLLLLRAFQNQKTRGVLFAGIGGALGVALALAPTVFAGALPGLVAHFLDTVGHHPILSANAHNLWWLVMRGNINVPDESILFAGLSYRAVGLILLAGAYGLALLLVILSGAKNLGSAVKRFFVAKNAPQNDMLGRDVWLAAAYVGFAFFILPTEIHENYGFAVLALLAVAIAFEKRWEVIALYAVLSVTMVVNYALYDPNVFALLGVSAPDAQLLNARWVNAAVNVVVFGAWTARVIADCRFQEEDVK
jgi:Gpi18-like mannosyltransferase